MKRSKLLLSGIAVLAIVGSSLAFKASTYFSDGSVFCSTSCSTLQQVGFRLDPNGTQSNPCAAKTETIPYYFNGLGSCVNAPTTAKFTATNVQGN
jgi:hypothetical protein